MAKAGNSRRRASRRTVSPTARARYAKRRTRRLSQVTNDLTDEQWLWLMDKWGGCAYCQSTASALQKDCIQPIARRGRYTFDNVVPACAGCNASKGSSEVSSWMRRKKLDEETFLRRCAEYRMELLRIEQATE